jgi:hypothetical protein
VKSDFITPSMYWVETEEEKMKLICGYKKALRYLLVPVICLMSTNNRRVSS